jgi:hypothetical protein
MKYKEIGTLAVLLAAIAWLTALPGNVAAQGANGIITPAPGDVISGIVVVQGTAVDSSFLRYEISFLRESGGGGDWIVFAQGDQPVVNGTLAVWDTTVGGPAAAVFPDGLYQLRLRVVRTDYNYDEYYVSSVIVANGDVTPSPTPTAEVTQSRVTPLPVRPTLESTLQPGFDVLPSLTPFPTPSPRATPENAPLGPVGGGDDPGEEEGQGVFQRIRSLDTSQFGRAFWLGVRIVFFIFVVLAFYLIFRGLIRRLWRQFQTRVLR